jgi:hypothetical protein
MNDFYSNLSIGTVGDPEAQAPCLCGPFDNTPELTAVQIGEQVGTKLTFLNPVVCGAISVDQHFAAIS